jgi:putative FmdB family regulatory protein
MPYYDYECKNCNKVWEVEQKITDKKLTLCPYCQNKKLIRLINNPAIIFKGAGFYVNDYKNKN